jgi:hypothetical protein
MEGGGFAQCIVGHGTTQAAFAQGPFVFLLGEAILPLLGDLTGRRLGLRVHLRGSDIREK